MIWHKYPEEKPEYGTNCLCRCDSKAGVWYDVFRYIEDKDTPWFSAETETRYFRRIVDQWIPISDIEENTFP